MEDIEKACIIRDLVLGEEENVERVSVTIDGAEQPAWRVTGDGWYALVSNLWDLHVASSRARSEPTNRQEAVIGHELLELYFGNEAVMSFCYRIEGGDEHLFEYFGGEWEDRFIPRRAPQALDRAA